MQMCREQQQPFFSCCLESGNGNIHLYQMGMGQLFRFQWRYRTGIVTVKCKLCTGNKARSTLKYRTRNLPKQLLNWQSGRHLRQSCTPATSPQRRTAGQTNSKSWIFNLVQQPTTGEGELMKAENECWIECLLSIFQTDTSESQHGT